jgi:hypothetical protein
MLFNVSYYTTSIGDMECTKGCLRSCHSGSTDGLLTCMEGMYGKCVLKGPSLDPLISLTKKVPAPPNLVDGVTKLWLDSITSGHYLSYL